MSARTSMAVVVLVLAACGGPPHFATCSPIQPCSAGYWCNAPSGSSGQCIEGDLPQVDCQDPYHFWADKLSLPDGGAEDGIQCQAKYDGCSNQHSYAISCVGTTCSCTLDDADAGSFTSNTRDGGDACSSDLANQTCNIPMR